MNTNFITTTDFKVKVDFNPTNTSEDVRVSHYTTVGDLEVNLIAGTITIHLTDDDVNHLKGLLDNTKAHLISKGVLS